MVRAGSFPLILACLLVACDSTGPATSIGRLPDSVANDTTAPPPEPPDTTGPVDTLPPPSDSAGPPPDTTGPAPYTPTHVGIPFGPAQMPAKSFSPEFSGTIYPASALGSAPSSLLDTLEKARRVNARLYVNFTGNEDALVDEKGFSLPIWKQRVDRFRHLDLRSYIEDGTIIGHFINDEPNDPSNWNGTRISPALVEEMAKYSKEIWPTMPTMVGVWPSYLMGQQFQYLDAARVHYHIRFGSLEAFIADHTRDAKALGLALVSGLNLLNGGTGESGIPGRKEGKFAMSAREITNWGNAVMADPYICAFVMWEHDEKYLARADIKTALAELKKKAEAHPEQACRRP
jgi:hypothetical protein